MGLYDTDFKNLLYRTFTTAEGLYSFAVINNDYKLKVMDNKYALKHNGQMVTELFIPRSNGTDTTKLIAEDLVVYEKES